MVKLIKIAVALSVGLMTGTASAEVPYQFIAKQYTEVLGRAPDQSGWTYYANGFSTSGCSQAMLRQYGRQFYQSNEFASRGYNASEKVVVAYRGILSREPSASEVGYWVTQLQNGIPWMTVVDNFFNNSEFASLVSRICMGRDYSANGGRPYVITSSRDQATLQQQLYTNGVVVLNPQEVVYLTSTLYIPVGALLTTRDAVDANQTARFGRLVRDRTFNGPLVELRGTMDKVWVDGQGGRLTSSSSVADNTVTAMQGTIQNSRLSDPAGWTNLQAPEWCTGPVTIANNLITGYANPHSGVGGWADGLSIACSGSTARYNSIIDATDVGIIVFSRQSSAGWSGTNIVARNNTVIAAGRSAYAGLAFDAGHQDGADFTGSYIQDNLLWTSPLQHFDIALTMGTNPWDWGMGANATAIRNGSGSLRNTVHLGIVVDGMLNATVLENNFSPVGVNTGIPCPQNSGVSAHFSPSPGHATGNIQGPTSNMTVHGCMYHP
ncbi:Hypothetical protein AA314_04980 [Archangium gephyra]|uniref:DUF4214 domain-containing protein n=1 Tax=Archangium gephyra TaxID=48 RepID=A0AAC8Q9G6_9BACT|nr:Hypothetical protein AA314_04980 [Archangium gephyra]